MWTQLIWAEGLGCEKEGQHPGAELVTFLALHLTCCVNFGSRLTSLCLYTEGNSRLLRAAKWVDWHGDDVLGLPAPHLSVPVPISSGSASL